MLVFSFHDGMQLIAGFTGVPLREVIATLGCDGVFTDTAGWGTTTFMRRRELEAMAEKMANALEAAELWWRAPGVCVHDVPTEKESEFVATGRSGPPTRHASPVPATTTATAGGRTSEEPAMRPTRNSGSWKDCDDSRDDDHLLSATAFDTTTTIATIVAPAMTGVRTAEEAVAAAFKKLGVLAAAPSPWDLMDAQNTKEQPVISAPAASAGAAGRTCESGEWSVRQSPLPAPPEESNGDASPPPAATVTPPPPSSTTLGELQGFVHRGRDMKVCREFLHTGSCSYGARCLYHHVAKSSLPSATSSSESSLWTPETNLRVAPLLPRNEGDQSCPAAQLFPPPLPRSATESVSTITSWRTDTGRDPLPLFAQTVLSHTEQRWPRRAPSMGESVTSRAVASTTSSDVATSTSPTDRPYVPPLPLFWLSEDPS